MAKEEPFPASVLLAERCRLLLEVGSTSVDAADVVDALPLTCVGAVLATLDGMVVQFLFVDVLQASVVVEKATVEFRCYRAVMAVA